jgi:hypothetical protein
VLLGWLALLSESRGPAHGGAEVRVAAAAMATFADDDLLAVVGEVGNLVKALLGVDVELIHHRAKRHRKQDVLSVGAVTLGTLAVRSALSLKMMLEAVVDERGALGVGYDDDVAAVPAVTSVGAALGDVGLATERHAAGAAISALYVDVYLVDEHDVLL